MTEFKEGEIVIRVRDGQEMVVAEVGDLGGGTEYYCVECKDNGADEWYPPEELKKKEER